jgi:hypothetical protein
MMLVSLQQAKDHLNEIGDDRDDEITLKIKGASRMIYRYIQDGSVIILESTNEPAQDSEGNPIVDEDIQTATLMMVGYLMKNKDEDSEKAWELGKFPNAVTAQIYHLRRLSMA